VTELDELNIPKATRPVAEEIIGITDEVCAKLLDAEYASLARQVVAKLARKRPRRCSAAVASPGPPPSSTPWGRSTSCSTLPVSCTVPLTS